MKPHTISVIPMSELYLQFIVRLLPFRRAAVHAKHFNHNIFYMSLADAIDAICGALIASPLLAFNFIAVWNASAGGFSLHALFLFSRSRFDLLYIAHTLCLQPYFAHSAESCQCVSHGRIKYACTLSSCRVHESLAVQLRIWLCFLL